MDIVKLINRVINEELGKNISRLKESTYTVTWSDRNYKKQTKIFKDDPQGPPENGLIKARKFKKQLEDKDAKDPYGNIRGSVSIEFDHNETNEDISKLTEKSESEEIREMAVDLIDYLGAQLPSQIPDRAKNFFRELGFKDTDPMVKKVYQTALQLNSGNR